jgi:hypothetical protein
MADEKFVSITKRLEVVSKISTKAGSSGHSLHLLRSPQ